MSQKVEIIAIGDELTSGRIQNTTSSFAARHLFDAGYDIYAITIIGDRTDMIGEALQQALARADAIIVTGGLGSTDDDITSEAASKILQRPMELNPKILKAIHTHLGKSLDTFSANFEKMAKLPSGAEAFDPKGKIAGYQLIHNNTPLFFLPGVPPQMQRLLIKNVLPTLSASNNRQKLTTTQRIYRIFDMPEIEVNRRVTSLNLSSDVQIGYYPVFPEVHLSLTVRCEKKSNTIQLFNSSARAIQNLLNEAIYGIDEESMEIVVGNLLRAKQLTLATAESCTGGMISETITNTPGSSDYFLGGVVSYANSMKTSFLGVSSETLSSSGAVSRETAEQMATGIQSKSGSDIGLSVTGIAGPGGGTAQKPVGTVYIGLATKDKCRAHHFSFTGNREEIRLLSAYNGLNLIRKYLLQKQNQEKSHC